MSFETQAAEVEHYRLWIDDQWRPAPRQRYFDCVSLIDGRTWTCDVKRTHRVATKIRAHESFLWRFGSDKIGA